MAVGRTVLVGVVAAMPMTGGFDSSTVGLSHYFSRVVGMEALGIELGRLDAHLVGLDAGDVLPDFPLLAFKVEAVGLGGSAAHNLKFVPVALVLLVPHGPRFHHQADALEAVNNFLNEAFDIAGSTDVGRKLLHQFASRQFFVIVEIQHKA